MRFNSGAPAAVLFLMAGLLLLAQGGCSGKGKKNEDFVPAPDQARRALEAALTSWKDGHPPGSVAGTSAPKVEAVDTVWQGGLKLLAFEVVKEESDGQGPRFFTVRLTPATGLPQEVRYVVFGIDPLWVSREEDYIKLTGTGK